MVRLARYPRVIRYVQPVSRSAAAGETARVYDGLRDEFGIHAEPIVLHSPNPDVLAGAWSVCRETLVAAGEVDRAVKEAVAIAVSEVNACPYCVDAHAAMLAGSDVPPAPEVERIVEWARATRTADAPILAAPPFGPQESAEMIGTAVLFHYINRVVTVFLGASPLPAVTRIFRGGAVRIAGRRFRGFVRARPSPGATLDLLPDATLPADFAWAAASPSIAGAWARFCAVVDREGEAALPRAVRTAVMERLRGWRGEDPGLGDGWLDDAIADVPDAERAGGRLAMLVALAPYRVDESVVEGYTDGDTADGRLVAAVSWPALAAARRVATWLREGT
jgi:AhpD family alkylhydroperoxidase